MRSVFQAWPARLLAALTALALIAACVTGAYVHAAEHTPLHLAEHGTTAVGAGGHAGHHHAPAPKAATPKLGHIGDVHDGDGTGQSHLDCCDTLCHGGQAILVASLPVPHPTLYAPLIRAATALDGAEPGGLERPPKPSRPV
jgi:hypothetical protein